LGRGRHRVPARHWTDERWKYCREAKTEERDTRAGEEPSKREPSGKVRGSAVDKLEVSLSWDSADPVVRSRTEEQVVTTGVKEDDV
jgi:hypothetical protein